MDLEERVARVASTWTPLQRLHSGSVAWHGTGCDGAPPADLWLEGPDWFAEIWLSENPSGTHEAADVDAHFSPRLTEGQRQSACEQIRAVAPQVTITVASAEAMAATARSNEAQEVDEPYFLLQHRTLTVLPEPTLPKDYRILTAAEAGEDVRVRAHQNAWSPERIKTLLGLPIGENEPPSSFSTSKYRAMKEVSIYRPELDLVVLAPDGAPAAFALGWLDARSRSVLFEPVGTSPAHARRGLSTAICTTLLHTAKSLGAQQAIVGPRGDDAYPIPRHLYTSLGFTNVGRTHTLAWGPKAASPAAVVV